jgi:hypothetical protein
MELIQRNINKYNFPELGINKLVVIKSLPDKQKFSPQRIKLTEELLTIGESYEVIKASQCVIKTGEGCESCTTGHTGITARVYSKKLGHHTNFSLCGCILQDTEGNTILTE